MTHLAHCIAFGLIIFIFVGLLLAHIADSCYGKKWPRGAEHSLMLFSALIGLIAFLISL